MKKMRPVKKESNRRVNAASMRADLKHFLAKHGLIHEFMSHYANIPKRTLEKFIAGDFTMVSKGRRDSVYNFIAEYEANPGRYPKDYRKTAKYRESSLGHDLSMYTQKAEEKWDEAFENSQTNYRGN